MTNLNELKPCYENESSGLEEMKGASSDEVLVKCLNKCCRVDLPLMSEASGKSIEALVADLKGRAIFQDPSVFEYEEWSIEKGWRLSSQYFWGNLTEKLEVAVRMNERYPGCFSANIEVLKSKMPVPLTIADIYINLGAPWIPETIVARFIKEFFKLKRTPTVIFNREEGVWIVKVSPEEASSFLNTKTYAVPRERDSYSYDEPKPYLTGIGIIERILNNKTIKIYDYYLTSNYKYEAVLNKEATLVAQEKEKDIRLEFDKWVRSDEKLCKQIVNYYNEAFCGYFSSPYDGSFLELPNLNPDVKLYPRQKNGVARVLLSEGNVLFAHDVGTGKTYILCVSMHELYRMKVSTKNLAVVPNANLVDFVGAHKHLYPNDKILVIYPDDFNDLSNRNKILEEIRDGDYVAVYMAYSSFNMIKMSKDYWIEKMTKEILSLNSAISCARHKSERKMLEKKKETLTKNLSDFVVEGEETDWLAFDKLGIETLVVDEAHNFKNIPLSTKADNIVGMHATGSVKCKEMAEKTKVVKKVIFATATPITNSLSDLFALQTYLQSEELKFRGIDAFDMWLNSFADKRTSFEVEPDGKRLRSITRFSKFHNLTELMMLFSTVCDFYYSDENNELLPKFDGYIKVCVEKCKAQTEYYNELSTRIDRVRSRKVTPTEDNLLKITVDGRSCAVHPQLVGDKYKVLPGEESKITKCAEKVIELYLEYPETCQLVFSDVGTPKSEFNVYDALKEELVKRGIRAAEIAYIHDATTEKARTRLFAAINSGKVRVVIGSTVKLGVGVNVQERLIAIHHLSVPWRPSDLTQRDGRLIRQGNTCEKVFIYCYVTTGTFDSYSWQLLETKQRFISNFLSATLASREADDVSDTVLNYAEIKALAVGNPLIKQRIETSNLLERVLSACRSRQNELTRLRVIVDSTPAKIKKLKLQLAVLKLDIKHYEKNRESVPKEERMAFGEELLYALSENSMQVSERYFEEYQGFKIYLPADMKAEEPYVIIRSANGGKYEVKMNTDKSLGCATRIDNKLVCLSDDAAKAEESIAVCERQREVAIADIEKGNKYLDEVQEVRKLLADIDRILEEEENIVA